MEENQNDVIWNTIPESEQQRQSYRNGQTIDRTQYEYGYYVDKADLWNDIIGRSAQNAEFAQQEYLLDKQNAYNTPYQQMKRMKEAGINPNIAAAAIAGNGNISAQPPQVSTNTGGVANGLGAIADVAGAITGGASELASAKETNRLLEFRAQQIQAETIKALEDAGVSHWNAMSVATLLPTMEANQKADFYLKLAQITNTRASYKNILAEHESIMQGIKESQSRISQMEYQNALIQEETRWQKLENDFFESHGYKSDSPLDVSLRNSVVSGNGEAEAIGSAIETVTNKSFSGQYSAEAEFAFEISQARKNGENVSDVLYGRIGSPMDFCGRIASMGSNIIGQAVDKIQNAFKKGDAKKVRSELTGVLNNAYEALEKYPEDAEHYQSVIDSINSALMLSNVELLQWYSKQNE